MSEPKDVFIRGESVVLRPLREDDLKGNWFRWFNDQDITWFQNKGIFPNTIELQEAFFRNLQTDKSQVTLAIESEGAHIGNVTLKDIDWVHRTAELGIVIGEQTHHGKGRGAESWWLMTRYGFLSLNLNKITARIFSGNDRSLRASQRAAYVREGEQAEQFYRHGRYYSLILVGVTASHWREAFGTDERRAFSESQLAQSTGL